MIKIIGSFLLTVFVIFFAFSFNKSAAEVKEIMPEEASMIKVASDLPVPENSASDSEEKTIEEFCGNVNHKFNKFGWKKIICNPDRWEIFHYSSEGNPIIYQTFGFDDPDNKGPVNLIFCGVHGDEPPSVYLCFRLVREILFDNPQALKNIRLVIAPLVNPDGFFAQTRQNSNGVDPNRNLPTQDWEQSAYKVWSQSGKDPRKNPGVESGTEPESKLQISLINKYKPDKILSVHAPLGFLDFDGPGDRKYTNLNRVEKRAKFLGLNIEANSKKALKLIDFPFYPGSLGNYAGNERKIPTYTLELTTADASKAHHYWSVLRYAFVKALKFEVYDENEENPFYTVQHLMNQLAYEKSGLTTDFHYN
jgi:protein MpaA